MENQDKVLNEIEKIRGLFEKAEWLGLQHLKKSITAENLISFQQILLSEILKESQTNISNFWPDDLQPFEYIFKAWLETITFNTLRPEEFYSFLVNNSYIPPHGFSKHFINSFKDNIQAFYNLYTSEVYLKIYSYLKLHNLYSDSQEKIQIIVTKGEADIKDDNKFTNPFYRKCNFLVQSKQIITNKSKRSDSLFIIGRNASSQLIDANFYSNDSSEDVICLITANPYNLIFVDMDLEDHSGIRLIEPLELKKNQVFRLGYFGFISILNVRNTRNPILEFKSYHDSKEKFILSDLNFQYEIGKEGSPFAWDISALSNKHCKIWYDQRVNKWMIDEIETLKASGFISKPTNGTWLLIKNKDQFENNTYSSPVHLDRSNSVILNIGRQICIVDINDD